MQREQKLAEHVEHRLSVRIRVSLCPLFLCVLSDSAVKYPFLPGKDSQDSSTDTRRDGSVLGAFSESAMLTGSL